MTTYIDIDNPIHLRNFAFNINKTEAQVLEAVKEVGTKRQDIVAHLNAVPFLGLRQSKKFRPHRNDLDPNFKHSRNNNSDGEVK